MRFLRCVVCYVVESRNLILSPLSGMASVDFGSDSDSDNGADNGATDLGKANCFWTVQVLR